MNTQVWVVTAGPWKGREEDFRVVSVHATELSAESAARKARNARNARIWVEGPFEVKTIVPAVEPSE